MKQEKIIDAFDYLGLIIEEFLLMSEDEQIIKFPELSTAVRDSQKQNIWFVSPFVTNSLKGIRLWLDKNTLTQWCKENHIKCAKKPLKVGLVMAGNIPLVGFHDFLSVLLSGHTAVVKLSSKDTILLPVLASYLTKKCPDLSKNIAFVPEIKDDIQALIATGSSNTMRYFSYRYEKIPSILRGSRNSIAIMTGKETAHQIDELSKDICLYFGMGCRSVAKVYVPDEKIIPRLQNSLSKFSWMTEHKDWSENLRFQKAVMLTRGQTYIDCGPVVMLQESKLSSPMSIIHFEKYDSIEHVKRSLKALEPMVQCVVGDNKMDESWVPFGKSQYPDINDFADRINTLEFLERI
jgi:hypothetical protein